MIRLSSKRVEIYEHCLASGRPEMSKCQDESTPARRTGSGKHKALEIYPAAPDWLTIKIQEALRPGELRQAQKQYESMAEWLKANWRDGWRTELGVAYNATDHPIDCLGTVLAPGEVMSTGQGRPPETPPGIVVSVFDVDAGEADDVATVIEWKPPNWTEHPKYSAQAQVNAMMGARLHGASEAFVKIVKTFDKGQPPYEMSHLFSEADFAATEQRLRAIVADMADEERWPITFEPGPWCKGAYCRARKQCLAFARWTKAQENQIAEGA